MQPLIARATKWFLSVPSVGHRGWSIVLLVVASGMALVDSAQLFIQIAASQVVAVPRIVGWEVSAVTATAALGTWAVGMGAFVHPRTRVALGWLAPLGAVASLALDSQTFADILYLITIAFAMHWWSAALGARAATSHLIGTPLRVLQTQISIVFLWTAFAKLNPRFLSGALLSVSFGGPVNPPEFLLDRNVLAGMAIATVIIEALFAITLWIDSLRRWALAGVVAFHGFILLFFQPTMALAAFACIMGSGYLLFAAEPWKPQSAPTGIVEDPLHENEQVT